MDFKMWKKKPALSVVVIFYNMRREAQRTLLSLSRSYQINSAQIPYEVIVIDNGSSAPLEKEWVEGLGPEFRYEYFDATTPSPSQALNFGVQIARGQYVMLCIDGARMLSPGILYHSMLATKLFKNTVVYTLGMHIGHKQQNYLVEEGYSQEDEDRLLETINWREDGYSLFDISSVAMSSKNGYLSRITESNCVLINRQEYKRIGGFDERFTSAGGGLVNLDFFNKINSFDDLDLVMLLGEATFHQFHGGTATNVAMKDHPIQKMTEEYNSIHKKAFEHCYKPPYYFGSINARSSRFFVPLSANGS